MDGRRSFMIHGFARLIVSLTALRRWTKQLIKVKTQKSETTTAAESIESQAPTKQKQHFT